MTEWKKEPPAAEGWYLTRLPEEEATCPRWWNGTVWSLPAYPDDPIKRVEVRAQAPTQFSDRLLWMPLPAPPMGEKKL